MAQRIVYVLETIEIDKVDCKTLMRTPGTADLDINPIKSHHPVWQTGQAVKISLAMQFRLLLTHFSDHGIECLGKQSQFVRRLYFDESVRPASQLLRCGDEFLNWIQNIKAEHPVNSGAKKENQGRQHQ